MKNLDSLALSKFSLNKAVRAAIKPGEYDVDVQVHIKGSIKIGEDYKQNITASIPWSLLLGVALSKLNGVTVDALLREIDTINEDDIKERAQSAVNKIKDKSKKPCKGKVTCSLSFEELNLTERGTQ